MFMFCICFLFSHFQNYTQLFFSYCFFLTLYITKTNKDKVLSSSLFTFTIMISQLFSGINPIFQFFRLKSIFIHCKSKCSQMLIVYMFLKTAQPLKHLSAIFAFVFWQFAALVTQMPIQGGTPDIAVVTSYTVEFLTRFWRSACTIGICKRQRD